VIFEFDELLDEARRRTGLSRFGSDAFHEPLRRLLESVDHESRLTAAGLASFREVLLHALVNRLQVEDWYHRHPEIDDRSIVAPVFIVGFPRTGSTLLSYLLALDPNTRMIRQWESEQPCPPPEAGSDADPRIAASEARHAAFFAAMPALAAMVPYGGASGPVECYELFYMTFQYAHYDMFVHCPSYTEWFYDAARDHHEAYRYHERVLKLLQWRHPPRRWVLKMPSHSLLIDTLNRKYPDARFIMTHRDPVKVLPSVTNLNLTVRRVHLEDPHPGWFGEQLVQAWDKAMQRLLEFRVRNEHRFFDVYHGRQLADSQSQMRALYDWLAWPLPERYVAEVETWRSRHPRSDNRYDIQDFGLDEASIRHRFAYYLERFPAVTQ
jgi:hypothetical protein